MNETITARGIIQVLGHPPEALTKTLEKVMEEIEKRVKVNQKNINEPQKIPNAQLMHSSFVEFEFETQNFNDFIGLMIDFGIMNIEIIKPKEMTITQNELQGSLNDLTVKFQEYTDMIRATQAANILLQRKMQEEAEQKQEKDSATAATGLHSKSVTVKKPEKKSNKKLQKRK